MISRQKRQASKEEASAVDAALSDHYAQLLGIHSPWRVLRVDLQLEQQRVVIEVDHDPALAVGCPECECECARYDHAPERTWRHLDVMQFATEIRARTPRCNCVTHGVQTVRVPWAEPGARFTLLFEAFAIKVIDACRTLTQVCDLLRLDWDSVQRIVDRAVARGLLRRSTEGVDYVGLDEKSFGKGQDYISTMTDLKGHRVLEVVPGRDTPSALALWEKLPEGQRKEVRAAAMDMGANFIAATKQAAPQADIVHDKFHISKPLNEAVDQVRREEHQRLLEKGDASLTGTKFLWLQGAAVTGERALTFEELCERNLKTARAWAHKETFVEFWLQPDKGRGLEFFEDWFRAVRRSKLEPMKEVALTLKNHLGGLLTYFEHPITNALTEGFNSKIQSIKADARGFRRFENYRARILFFCGKLEMMPDGAALGHPL
jgi:transposase